MFRCSGEGEDRIHKQVGRYGGDTGKEQQEHETVAQNSSGTLAVSLSQSDGSEWGTTSAHDGGERGNQDDDGTGYSDSGQCLSTYFRNMADVNTVDNTIQKVDELSRDRRQCHTEDERQHAVGT